MAPAIMRRRWTAFSAGRLADGATNTVPLAARMERQRPHGATAWTTHVGQAGRLVAAAVGFSLINPIMMLLFYVRVFVFDGSTWGVMFGRDGDERLEVCGLHFAVHMCGVYECGCCQAKDAC